MTIQIDTTNASLTAAAQSGSIVANPLTNSTDQFQSALESAIESVLTKYGVQADGVKVTVDSQNAAATPVVNSTPTSASDSIDATQPESFDDAYWAKQPEAVQQLRNIDDYDTRMAAAGQLAAQGYNVDVPIMAWGWDPAKVTSLRQDFGYTWVPASYQNPVGVAPGLAVPGMAAYDPANPPPNSIQVG